MFGLQEDEKKGNRIMYRRGKNEEKGAAMTYEIQRAAIEQERTI